MIHSLQMILQSTLQAAYSAAHTSRLVLPLSRSSLLPRPNYHDAACIASGLEWQEWIALPGSQDFDLILSSVHTAFVDQAQDIVHSAADVVLETLKNEFLKWLRLRGYCFPAFYQRILGLALISEACPDPVTATNKVTSVLSILSTKSSTPSHNFEIS